MEVLKQGGNIRISLYTESKMDYWQTVYVISFFSLVILFCISWNVFLRLYDYITESDVNDPGHQEDNLRRDSLNIIQIPSQSNQPQPDSKLKEELDLPPSYAELFGDSHLP